MKIRGMDRHQQNYALNEVRLLASLDHPNIIRFLEAFPNGTSNYNLEICLVMEYADSGDLDQAIRKHQRLKTKFSEATLWNYAGQITRGLCYLHRNQNKKKID